MPKNIAVFIDGTDTTFTSGAKNNTNVGTLYEACINDARQFKFYSDGPGYGHLLASAVGTGVNVRVQRGYDWCAENYEDGDQIFLFGFSRGAFAVRSVAGMIRAVGLLRKDKLSMEDAAFSAYQNAKTNPAAAAAFKAANSRSDVKVHCIGVWDTVGSVHVPLALTLDAIPLAPFHDVTLGPDIENAFHAVSIDEERWDFQPTYFNAYLAQPGQTVEEVFFPGVHSDIGGGYADDPSLSRITLAWIANRAKDHGLLIADESVLKYNDDDCYGTLHNSFTALYDLRSRFFRPIDFNARLHKAAQQRLAAAKGVCKPDAYDPRNVDRNNKYNWVET
jgi:uncharacterized protein (DUF2235 family)